MPHQCTDCGCTFPDGSKQMLAGCPDCGGKKFQFLPASADDKPAGDDPSTQSTSTDDEIIEAPTDPEWEDRAQASARRALVSEDELPSRSPEDPVDASPETEPEEADLPSLSELRAELNDQFESIKILAPGEYELNLMELYDRPEYIIAIEEDGRYVIDVPDRWSETG